MSYRRYSGMMGSYDEDEEEYEENEYDEDVEMDMSGFLNNPPSQLKDRISEEAKPPVTPRPRQKPSSGMGYTQPNSMFSDPSSVNAHTLEGGGWHSFRPSWAHDAALKGNPIVVTGTKTVGSALFVGSALYNLGYRGGTGIWSSNAWKAMAIGGIPMYLQPSLGWNYGALDAILPSGGFMMKLASTGAKAIGHGGLLWATWGILRS